MPRLSYKVIKGKGVTMTPEELWAWIERQEKRYMDTDIPITERQVDFLIKNLRSIEHLLPDEELYKNFADKMAIKFQRMGEDAGFMLFDFVKNLIHTVLIKKEHYTPYPLKQP